MMQNPPLGGIFLPIVLKYPPVIDKMATADSQAAYTARLFSLWLRVIVAAAYPAAI